MGMAASQARLLSLTARLTDNEQTAQALAYAKERLADKSEQVTDEYNNALSATKLQIMIGYVNGAADFSDVSYSMLSSPQVINLGKQYIVTDAAGKVLVTNDVAEAFLASSGSCNRFLGILGYSLSDVNPTLKGEGVHPTQGEPPQDQNDEAHAAIVEQIHEAWDRYFVSIGKTDYDSTSDTLHPWTFAYHNRTRNFGDGYATISMDGGETEEILNYEGTTQEQLDLYNYAMAITESFYSGADHYSYVDNHGQTVIVNNQSHDFTKLKTYYNMENRAEIDYYKNLFDKMLASGFYSYTNNASLAHDDPDHWVFAATSMGAGTVDASPLSDAHTFQEYLKSGKLILHTFSTTKNKFEKTSLAADNCFQEVEDKTKIALAESKYNKDLQQLERLDTRYDLQIKRLDTEHNTLQTEYEAVKKVISNNVQSSFKTFS